MNYYTFLKESHKPKTPAEIKDEEERQKMNEQIETQMKNKMLLFARTGNPGSKFKP